MSVRVFLLLMILLVAIAYAVTNTYLRSAGYQARVAARAQRWAIEAENLKALNGIAVETARCHAERMRAELLAPKAAAEAVEPQVTADAGGVS